MYFSILFCIGVELSSSKSDVAKSTYTLWSRCFLLMMFTVLLEWCWWLNKHSKVYGVTGACYFIRDPHSLGCQVIQIKHQCYTPAFLYWPPQLQWDTVQSEYTTIRNCSPLTGQLPAERWSGPLVRAQMAAEAKETRAWWKPCPSAAGTRGWTECWDARESEKQHNRSLDWTQRSNLGSAGWSWR